MVKDKINPMEEIIRIKDDVEKNLVSIESEMKGNAPLQVLFGIEHENLPQAFLADIVDALPILGEISDVSRIRLAKEQGRRFMHAVDLAVDILPPPLSTVADLFLPTNTLWYLEKEIKKGKL